MMQSALNRLGRHFSKTASCLSSIRQLHCTGVIVGSVSDSFAAKSIRAEEPVEPINLTKARLQHDRQVEELGKLVNGNIAQITPYEEYPDLVFAEDSACVINGKALMAQMKPETRAGEIIPMRQALEENALKFGIKEIAAMETPEAYLDVGDVIFTGREFLIGLSQRTNALGIEEFAKHFPLWPVCGIKIPLNILHLKSLSSFCGQDRIAIGSTTEGQKVWKEIEQLSKYKYKRIAFPDNNGANCVLMNGTILHIRQEEYPLSYEIWQKEEFSGPRVSLANSEMSKADGSLTCNSMRIIETD